MYKSRSGRSIVIIGLFVCVISLSVAFAALSQSLNIAGAGKIKGSNWNIIFDNLSSSTVGSAQNESSVIQGETTISLSANLKKPGDKIVYIFDVVNNGTIDAIVSDVNISGIDNNEIEDLNINFSYNNDNDYGNALPKTNDTLFSGKTRPLKVEIEFDSNASTVSTVDRTLNFTVSIIYVQASGNLVNGDNPGSGFDFENTFSDTDTVSSVSEFNYMYPARAASNGFTISEADTNEFIFTSPGIYYKYNGVYNDGMVGKNILMKFEIATSGVDNIGAGFFVQLRKYKEGETSDPYDKDYYGVIYDGTTFKIVSSVNSVLNTMVSFDIAQSELGNYYSTTIKTFNNLIHAELRDSNGVLKSSLDYLSSDFNNHIPVTNCISYNNNVRLRNIQSKILTNFTSIIAFGDSNTYGDSLPSGERVNLSWPGQINNLAKTTNIIAMNKGVTYHTSGDLVNRLTTDVYNNKIIGARNIAIIYIGTNDFNQKYSAYQAAFNTLKSNVETMRVGMEANGFEVWLITFPVCNDPIGPGQGRNEGLRAYNSWIVDDYYGIQKKVPVVIDFASVAVNPNDPDKLLPEYVASDGLHSSGFANSWISAQVIDKL